MLEGTMAVSSATAMQSRHQLVSCSASSCQSSSVTDPEVPLGLQACGGGPSMSKSAWRSSARGWADMSGGAKRSTCAASPRPCC